MPQAGKASIPSVLSPTMSSQPFPTSSNSLQPASSQSEGSAHPMPSQLLTDQQQLQQQPQQPTSQHQHHHHASAQIISADSMRTLTYIPQMQPPQPQPHPLHAQHHPVPSGGAPMHPHMMPSWPVPGFLGHQNPIFFPGMVSPGFYAMSMHGGMATVPPQVVDPSALMGMTQTPARGAALPSAMTSQLHTTQPHVMTREVAGVASVGGVGHVQPQIMSQSIAAAATSVGQQVTSNPSITLNPLVSTRHGLQHSHRQLSYAAASAFHTPGALQATTVEPLMDTKTESSMRAAQYRARKANELQDLKCSVHKLEVALYGNDSSHTPFNFVMDHPTDDADFPKLLQESGVFKLHGPERARQRNKLYSKFYRDKKRLELQAWRAERDRLTALLTKSKPDFPESGDANCRDKDEDVAEAEVEATKEGAEAEVEAEEEAEVHIQLSALKEEKTQGEAQVKSQAKKHSEQAQQDALDAGDNGHGAPDDGEETAAVSVPD
eukprot:m.52635 g.52635  ORF g.52635 m.52635 type:complete len:492 (+) comp11322_c0_seq3:2114-3589(+)